MFVDIINFNKFVKCDGNFILMKRGTVFVLFFSGTDRTTFGGISSLVPPEGSTIVAQEKIKPDISHTNKAINGIFFTNYFLKVHISA